MRGNARQVSQEELNEMWERYRRGQGPSLIAHAMGRSRSVVSAALNGKRKTKRHRAPERKPSKSHSLCAPWV